MSEPEHEMNDRRTMIRSVAAVAAMATASLGGRAADHAQRAMLTTIDLAACRTVQAAGGSATAWRCEGIDGNPLYVAMEGRRTYLSAGPEPGKRRAARQTLAAVNTPVDARSGRIAIEWRLEKRGGKAQPYATIVRYFTTSERARGEVLVVSRIAGDDSCQVARIDALANEQAMTLARRIADETARGFDCRREPTVAGRAGRSPM